jgi:hypothetical protein
VIVPTLIILAGFLVAVLLARHVVSYAVAYRKLQPALPEPSVAAELLTPLGMTKRKKTFVRYGLLAKYLRELAIAGLPETARAS